MKMFFTVSLASLVTLSAISAPTGVDQKVTEANSISNVKSVSEAPAVMPEQVTDAVTQSNTKLEGDSPAMSMEKLSTDSSSKNQSTSGFYGGGGITISTD